MPGGRSFFVLSQSDVHAMAVRIRTACAWTLFAEHWPALVSNPFSINPRRRSTCRRDGSFALRTICRTSDIYCMLRRPVRPIIDRRRSMVICGIAFTQNSGLWPHRLSVLSENFHASTRSIRTTKGGNDSTRLASIVNWPKKGAPHIEQNEFLARQLLQGHATDCPCRDMSRLLTNQEQLAHDRLATSSTGPGQVSVSLG